MLVHLDICKDVRSSNCDKWVREILVKIGTTDSNECRLNLNLTLAAFWFWNIFDSDVFYSVVSGCSHDVNGSAPQFYFLERI